jgi:NADH dehydrogenase
MAETHIVTGAFGYSGKYITRRLLEEGINVRTLTNSLNRSNPFGSCVQAFPLAFDNPAELTQSMRGCDVLYNTYWVRFNYTGKSVQFQHANAVDNTRKLFAAAKQAGLRRVVHVSITNPSEDSRLEYFRGKAQLERALKETGLSYAILRPTVLFGKEDILINNIAWMLRKLPVFGVFGDGKYRLQPIYVDDLAKLAVKQGKGTDNVTIDAIGPETFTYRGLVAKIGDIIGKRRWIVSVPDGLGYFMGWIVGKWVGDVMITREEIAGLKADLLYTPSPPAGQTRLTDWAQQHAATLSPRYSSELARRKNRAEAYENL